MEAALYAFLMLASLGTLAHGLIKGRFVIGVLGWHRATREGEPVRFVLFGLIYLAVALMFAWCLVLALRDG